MSCTDSIKLIVSFMFGTLGIEYFICITKWPYLFYWCLNFKYWLTVNFIWINILNPITGMLSPHAYTCTLYFLFKALN